MQYFSCDTPSLAQVIPTMDHIDHELTKYMYDLETPAPIHAAVNIAKKTLNRYYTRTDSSEVYRICMGKYSVICRCVQILTLPPLVLHPRHKLQYFRHAGWDTGWIQTAREIVEAEYEQDYENLDITKEASGTKVDKQPKKATVCAYLPSVSPLPTLTTCRVIQQSM